MWLPGGTFDGGQLGLIDMAPVLLNQMRALILKEITIVKMLCWSKQCQSLVKPHTPSSSLFHNAFQGVLLIKHFSWRRINYTVELLNRISHTNLLDERPTSPPCNSSPLVHRGSIEKRQTRHEVLVMCLGLHLGYLEKDK